MDGGVAGRFARHLDVGLEARYSAANIELGSTLGHQVAAGGVHAGVVIGYGW